ncbi:hypothetical protein GY45DRAFT_208007 [Cubamyces sp. BRFM 1775]|nr:hypothetical protein GY45DRAFT_208007 [Cubamyces sp. BRFM 1775]
MRGPVETSTSRVPATVLLAVYSGCVRGYIEQAEFRHVGVGSEVRLTLSASTARPLTHVHGSMVGAETLALAVAGHGAQIGLRCAKLTCREPPCSEGG